MPCLSAKYVKLEAVEHELKLATQISNAAQKLTKGWWYDAFSSVILDKKSELFEANHGYKSCDTKAGANLF